MFGIRAILLESQAVVAEGQAVIEAEASSWAACLFNMIRRNNKAQAILKNFFLRLHYRRIKLANAARRRAAVYYVQSNSDLALAARVKIPTSSHLEEHV